MVSSAKPPLTLALPSGYRITSHVVPSTNATERALYGLSLGALLS